MSNNNPDMAEAALLLQAAQPIMGSMRQAVDHCQLFKSAYAINYRLKSPTRMVEKVASRQAAGKDYTIRQLTDLIGARFITLYRDDIPAVVRSILLLITDLADVKPNFFAGWELIEFKVFVANKVADNDPLVAELKQIFLVLTAIVRRASLRLFKVDTRVYTWL